MLERHDYDTISCYDNLVGDHKINSSNTKVELQRTVASTSEDRIFSTLILQTQR